MRDPENLEQLCSLGPDYVGYIFYPGSKRFVGSKPDPLLFDLPPSEVTKVGVFVNESLAQVKKLHDKYHLDMVQLHGNESPLFCRDLVDSGIRVIKALTPGAELMDFSEVVQLFLFDTPGPSWGGTGKKFDWNLLAGRSIPLPFLMSGGIGPGDAEAVRQIEHSNFRGMDVNSRFEISPGLKDIRQLQKFFNELRTQSHGI